MPKPSLFTPAFLLAAAANLMFSLAGFSFVHLPGFLQQLGAGEAEIGQIMAASAIGAILAWPLIGRVMDARGRRIVFLTGGIAFCVLVAGHLLIRDVGPYVYILRTVDGVAHAMWYTALFTYGADLVPASRRTQGLAIFGISGVVTLGLGAQFGDVILAYANYRELFLGAFGLSALGLLLCLPLRDVRHAHHDDPVPARGIAAVATQRDLVPIWLAAIVFFMSLGTLFTFTKTFVASINVTKVSLFFGVYSLVAVVLRLFFGWLPDRLGHRRMLGASLSCYAAGMVALSIAHNPLELFVAGLLCGAGHGYIYPVLFSLVVERAKARERGTAMAFYTTLDQLGLLLAGPLFGFVIEWAGYGSMFATLATLLVTGMALFFVLDRAHHR